MAILEGRLFAMEEDILMPVVKQLPADWRVQIARAASDATFDVRVKIPNVGEHSKTFPVNDSVDIAQFLEWVRDNPNPKK
jgi:hypothetical protein